MATAPAAPGPARLAAYGLFGLPLATAALPIYVHLPRLYGTQPGMSLALLGGILLAARLADALTDPLLGALNDRLQRPDLLISCGATLLAGGVLMAFHPPHAGTPPWLWLSLALVPVYLGYSMASVSYLAWGALLGSTQHERTRVAACREGFGIAGVILASAGPVLLAPEIGSGLARFSLALVPVMVLSTVLLLAAAPRPARVPRPPKPSSSSLLAPLDNARFRALLLVFVLNGIASAVPATLALFYVDDILQAPASSGAFLSAYFLAGAASVPVWVSVSRRIGKPAAWFRAMLLAVAAFCGAFVLGSNDLAAFGAVCVLSGFALGADLVLPASMLADTLRAAGDEKRAGSYFGLWTLATKLNLALAAGLALPTLALFGYAAGNPSTVRPLYFAYCVLPCLLKLAAAFALHAKFGLARPEEPAFQ